MIVETFYDDPEAAREMARFRAESARPVPEVLQWPRRRDRSCTPGFEHLAAVQADAYVEAITGKAPSMTLRATGGNPIEGNAADAAGAGSQRAPRRATYTIAVADTSQKDGFRLVGPSVNRTNVPGVQRPCEVET